MLQNEEKWWIDQPKATKYQAWGKGVCRSLLWMDIKITNCLHIKVIYTYMTTIFRASLHPYIRLSIVGMKRETLILNIRKLLWHASKVNSFFVNSRDQNKAWINVTYSDCSD
jgi:hypothetical protein